jgi:hypothetical protein
MEYKMQALLAIAALISPAAAEWGFGSCSDAQKEAPANSIDVNRFAG